MNDKVLNMIGMATRAKKTISGEFSVEKAVKTGKAKLVIVATDASDNTKKLFTNKCSYYKIPCLYYSTKESLGHAIGKDYRASVAILDKNFANSIEEKIKIDN
ncbi:Ribosomal protein L7Ae [Acetitomaculum ruminis DSM 5522]|uniref:Ribosomal protein L7Ae n=2 Tax=Acetitomaculum ruminis TaxID=2382 RepID=A0A1I0XUG1_9FIRM|nr:ribosomal L7Ae/L30e/S12e/Gadd45 family protein [Acetitomaculum ruminis]SFB03613.1 Ribosomal protein L7Ae [Acetitomaculum ruminis DSM 5522]